MVRYCKIVMLVVLVVAAVSVACSSAPAVTDQEAGAAEAASAAAPQKNCSCDACPENPCCDPSPILIDVAGDGISLTSAADGVTFPVHPGVPQRVGWTAAKSDDAWLVLDRNGNGVIDDGTEMFGNYTLQKSTQAANGFAALAMFDANGDGLVDKHDPVFDELLLWRDANHDGVSQPEELTPLAVYGIEAVGVGASTGNAYVDKNGNQFLFNAPVFAKDGAPVGPLAWDAWLRPLGSRVPVKLGGDGEPQAESCVPPPTGWHCYAKCWSRLEMIRETYGIATDYSECGGVGYSTGGIGAVPRPDAIPFGTFYSLGAVRRTKSEAMTAAVQRCVVVWMSGPEFCWCSSPDAMQHCEQCDKYGNWASNGGDPVSAAYGCYPDYN